VLGASASRSDRSSRHRDCLAVLYRSKFPVLAREDVYDRLQINPALALLHFDRASLRCLAIWIFRALAALEST